ncbi:MAG: arylsulfatase [Alphaproteobacteria bacterium]|nr:arylsulfatase [Alphaproteobacteria bacterium]
MIQTCATIFAATLLSVCAAFGQSTRPNVVVMMVDNLGWGELGVYGGGQLRGAETPRLDKLAAEGTRLLNFNVEPQCTPSRSAFMTGRHPIRSGTTKVVWGVLYGMVGWEKTIAELFSGRGYATANFGKWHLGDTPGRFPTDQGFDEWYGIANTTDESMYTAQYGYDSKATNLKPFIVEAKKGQKPQRVAKFDVPARRRIDAELTRRAINFMRRQVRAKKPFFLLVTFTQPHLPTLPHPDFKGKTGNGPFADVLAEIDFRTGQVLDAIDELKIRDNTIVVWLSDNGPEETAGYHGTAGYWRGHYFTALEGSLRVPFIIRWPGKVPAGRVSNEIVHITDILPTFARVAGYKVPADRIIDGKDQYDFFLGKQKKSNREGFPVYNGDNMFAYKWRNWKVHFVDMDSMFGRPRVRNVPRVHNLITDPKEKYDLREKSTWVFPVVLRRVVKFRMSLVKEPPIRLGTPDPYKPRQKAKR